MKLRPLRTMASATSVIALVAAGIAATTTASQAAPEPVNTTLCPGTPIWTGSLVAGQHVTGKTTASGTTVEDFEGTYLDTQSDPFGNDIYVFDLSGSRITKADGSVDAGIWAGISGSPVYDDAGNLIGSVSYGFTGNAGSTVAGITPAQNIIETDPDITPDRARAAAKPFAVSSDVKKALKRADNPVSSASRWQQLALPRVTVGDAERSSVLASKSRELAKHTGSTTTTFSKASLVDDIHTIEPGGSVGTTWSYGDLPAASVGTVTAVCEYASGDKVYAYGHPDENLGASTQTMLSAQTTTIIADGGSSYKMVNLNPVPEGPLVQDGLNGIVGVLGAPLPHATSLTTSTAGRFAQSHQTYVTTPESLPSITAMQVSSEIANAFKNSGPGTVLSTWTINYTPKGGKATTYKRTQRVTATGYLSENAGYEAASDLEFLQFVSSTKVTINSVNVTSTVTPDYKELRVSGVDVLKSGKWVPVKSRAKVTARTGKTLKARVHLVPADASSTATPALLRLDQRIARTAKGTGVLRVAGAANYSEDEDDGFFTIDVGADDEEFYYDDAAPPTLAQVLAILKSQPRYDSILSTQQFVSTLRGPKVYARTAATPAVTTGAFTIRLGYAK